MPECEPCQFAGACSKIDKYLATCVEPGCTEGILDCIQWVPGPSLLICIHLQDANCHIFIHISH